jgi:hypothetical protein
VEGTFRPELVRAVEAADNSDPSRVVAALNVILGPAVEAAGGGLSPESRETLLWILMEITLNAINSRVGKGLSETTGMGRGELLDIIGVNVLYPDGSADRADYSGPGAVELAGKLDMGIPEFVRLSLEEKLAVLGTGTSPGWVTLETVSYGGGRFSVTVLSDDPVSDDDHREILRRFVDPVPARQEVQEENRHWEDGEGIFRMPSFTGGGGMGLLECIRQASECGMRLEYDPLEQGGARFPRFRISGSGRRIGRSRD